MNIFKTSLILLLILSCNRTVENKKDKDLEADSRIDNCEITRLPSELVKINHNFPDTLSTGDEVAVYVESYGKDWKIVQAFVNCPIGSDNTLKTIKRTKLECLELPVIDHKTYIDFVVMGQGEKVFDLVTLILEDSRQVRKATELQFIYYLK